MSIDPNGTNGAPTPAGPPPEPPVYRRRRGGFVFPLILIIGGGLFLLQNLGLLSGGFWDNVWKFWPLILIAFGIEAIVLARGNRLMGAVGGVVAVILVVAVVVSLAGAVITPVESANAWGVPGFHITWNNNHGFIDRVTGSGNVVTEERDQSDFREVQVAGPFEAQIVYADAYRVTITADDNLMERVIVEKRGDQLRIRLDNRALVGNHTLKARIEMPEVRAVKLSGAARGVLEGFPTQRDFDAQISGASRLSGYVQANVVTMNVSGASKSEIAGSANSLDATVSGASRLEMLEFGVRTADINASGASMGEVSVSDRLDANISGASQVAYVGSPVLGHTNVTGGGRLQQR